MPRRDGVQDAIPQHNPRNRAVSVRHFRQSLRDVTTRSTDWKEMQWLSLVEETKVSASSVGHAQAMVFVYDRPTDRLTD